MNLRQVAHALIGFCSRHGLDSPGPEMWDLPIEWLAKAQCQRQVLGSVRVEHEKRRFFYVRT